jgi:hypothetical protein
MASTANARQWGTPIRQYCLVVAIKIPAFERDAQFGKTA